MNQVSTIRLVAGREISERLRSRFAWVMTGITTLLAVALVVIPGLRPPPKAAVIGLVGSSAAAVGPALQAIARAVRTDIVIKDVANDADGRTGVANGSLDIALSIREGSAVAEVKRSLPPATGALLRAVVNEEHQRRALRDAGVPLSAIVPALRPVPLDVRALESPPSDQAARRVAALAAGFLLYLTLMTYGNAVAAGVAQEKTSRTAEVLFAAVRPSHLLSGKVLGIGVCGAGQMAITLAAGLIANAVVANTEISSTLWTLLPAILLWFTLGYALYAFAYAAAGAMVARQEEVQFVSMPVGMPLIGGLLLGYAAIARPDARWIRLISFLPPFAPVLMPARLALGHLAAWEMPVGVIIMVVSVFGMIRLAARVYSFALIRGGARLSWKSALRMTSD